MKRPGFICQGCGDTELYLKCDRCLRCTGCCPCAAPLHREVTAEMAKKRTAEVIAVPVAASKRYKDRR